MIVTSPSSIECLDIDYWIYFGSQLELDYVLIIKKNFVELHSVFWSQMTCLTLKLCVLDHTTIDD